MKRVSQCAIANLFGLANRVSLSNPESLIEILSSHTVTALSTFPIVNGRIFNAAAAFRYALWPERQGARSAQPPLFLIAGPFTKTLPDPAKRRNWIRSYSRQGRAGAYLISGSLTVAQDLSVCPYSCAGLITLTLANRPSQYQLQAACLGVSTRLELPGLPPKDLAVFRVSGLCVLEAGAYWLAIPWCITVVQRPAKVTLPRTSASDGAAR